MRSEQPEPKESSVELVEFRSTLRRPPPQGGRRVGAEPGSEDETLSSRLWTLREGKWVIAAILVTFLAAAVAYLLLATPIYRCYATLQLEDRTRTLAGMEELSAMFGEKVPAETEIEIIRSRMLLRSVVRELGLDLDAAPRRFPLIGGALARRNHGTNPAPAPFGLSRFAWGGERIRVQRLEVSDDLLDQPLLLTALDGDRYVLQDRDGRLRLDGEVGKVASAADGSRTVELFVSELVARPGTEFRLTSRWSDDVVDGLLDRMSVHEKGRRTGIIVVALDGADPTLTAKILNTLASAYVRQNVEQKSAEAAKTLEFLESQLPVVKANLEAAHSALSAFQVRKGTVDLSRETSSVLERSVEIDKAVQELEMQRAELRQRFTENHPALTSLNEKAQRLRAERAALAAQMREIPASEADSARLQRDVRSASELYTVLLNKAQELRVVKSGTIGNVRILDRAATARRPERPRPAIVLLFASVIGLAAGIAGAFAREALNLGTEDADEIEAGVGLPVYVTIPHSEHQGDVSRAAAEKSILAAVDPGDIAIESLRSLRTSLQFALVDSLNAIVTVSGPGPGVGKSFVCVNLASVLASAERRVLLVDCDLRRGGLHRYFGVDRHPGVSDVVSGSAEAIQAVRRTSNGNLDFLPTGRIPPNPAELLASHAFEQLLDWASASYDFVLVDTPPILAVTDPAVVARLAGVNLLVLRAGEHPLREIALAVKRFAQNGIKVHGAVLNDARAVRGRYGKFGRYRRYEYRSSGSPS